MVPILTGWIIAGLIVVLVVVTAALLLMPAPGQEPASGLRIRLVCPGDGGDAVIRVGKHPVSRELAVLWCDRFGDRAITCNRACLTDEIIGAAA